MIKDYSNLISRKMKDYENLLMRLDIFCKSGKSKSDLQSLSDGCESIEADIEKKLEEI